MQVTEQLAERTVEFLAGRPLPDIKAALDRLRAQARPGSEATDVTLLRRLILKHCVYGVDISPMGAEIATLSLWLASFVPGLSLAYLGRNVLVGNFLIGIASASTVVQEGTFQDSPGGRRRRRAAPLGACGQGLRGLPGVAVHGDDRRADRHAVDGRVVRLKSPHERVSLTTMLPKPGNLEIIGAAFAQGPGVPSVGPTGVFLACRTRDGERYWRYMADDGGIASAPATMLRRINPGDAPGVLDPAVDLESAWSDAAASIVEEHNDTARLSEKRSLGPVQRWARALLEDDNVSSPASAAGAYRALGAERSSLVRLDLAEIKRSLDSEFIDVGEAARKVAEVVEFHGLRAVDAQPSTLQITEEI